MNYSYYSKILLLIVFSISFFTGSAERKTDLNVDAAMSSACASGQLTLTITFDGNPEQIGWDIKDVNNVVYDGVVYGSYSGETPGSTITENITTLPDGDYVLVMIDAGGDGLCCNSGNGSYTFEDDFGVLFSGTISGYSDVTQFCMNVSNGDVIDTQAPTAPVLTASNITDTTADINWTASSDNVAVISYGIFSDGTYIGQTDPSILGGTLPSLTPNTTYSMHVVARDLIGNFSDPSNTETFTTTGGAPVETILHEGYFETGLDGWIDGGNDCFRYSGSKSYEGTYSMRLRDNSGVSSSMTSPDFDLSTYDEVKVSFHYFVRSMETGEDFWLRMYENGAWVTIEDFVSGVDFNGNGFYYAEVIIPSSSYDFDIDNKFRIQCDASANNDKIFVDQVIITGIENPSNRPSSSKLKLIPSPDFLSNGPVVMNEPLLETLQRTSVSDDFYIYPNPVADILRLEGERIEAVDHISIFDMSGRCVMKLNQATEIPMQNIKAGNYNLIIKLDTGDVIRKQIIKI